MSYFRALDLARTHLDRGDLLAAESELERAREVWENSRFRAPVVERRLEPALRRVGRWLGRRSPDPVLPVFGHKAALLEDDLRGLADLLRGEALAVLGRDRSSLVEADRSALEHALRLDRHSRFFSLSRTERWQALHGYLDSSRRLARGVDEGLLPEDVAGQDDVDWLSRWSEAVLAGGGVPTPGLIRWIEKQARALSRVDSEGAARWSWIAARAALGDPQGGERALDAVERAVRGGLDDAERTRATRLLAGLLANEHVLAVPGADVAEVLTRWRATVGVESWPPDEVAALLRARRVDPGRGAIAVAAWSPAGRELVLVLHRAGAPVDALAFRPSSTAHEPSSRFEASLPEARGWIGRWLPEDTIVLCEGAAPPSIDDLLARWPRLDVDTLLARVPAPDVEVEPVPGAVPHPLWTGSEGHVDFRPLADRARKTIPRLRAWLRACPAFTEAWGRDALRVMSEHGLDLCQVLGIAVDRLGEGREERDRTLQPVPLVVPLRWPRLEARDWARDPVAAAAVTVDHTVDRTREGTLWFDEVATLDELVEVAVASDRAEVMTFDDASAERLAGRCAARIDARRVGVGPRTRACPEPWLARLDEWLRAAVGDPDRQLDVLWLWRVLSETPNGDLHATTSDPRTRDLVPSSEPRHVCGPSCRLAAEGGCWAAQLEGRIEAARVWIVPVDRDGPVLPDPSDLLLDDPRAWVVTADEDHALRAIERTVARARTAPRTWVWSNAGRLAPALRAQWIRRVPGPLHVGTVEMMAPAALWLSPPGYRPGDPYLGEEGERLVRLRAEAWRDAGNAVAAWALPDETVIVPASRTVEGASRRPSTTVVVTPLLGAPGEVDPLVLLLRAAAAQGHATTLWVCLDPRLAHRLEHGGGSFPADEPLPGRLAEGVADAIAPTTRPGEDLLGDLGSSAPPNWAAPLTAARLERVMGEAGSHAEAVLLARSLRDWGRGRFTWIGGASDRQREHVVALVRTLAERSGDGGPLGVRCVVVVTERAHGDVDPARTRVGSDDTERLGAFLLEAERGRLTRVDLHPDLLRNEAVLSWARRVSSVAWVLLHAESLPGVDADGGTARGRQPWREALERSGAPALAFVDEVSEAPRDRLARWAAVFDGRAHALEPAGRSYREWILRLVDVRPDPVVCWNCGTEAVIASAATSCTHCDARLLDRSSVWRDARRGLDEALVRILRGHGDEGWWAITDDRDLVDRLRRRLGLEDYAVEQAPLLAVAGRTGGGPAVLHVDDLDEMDSPPARLLWLGVPDSVRTVERLLLRMTAMEAPERRLHVLLPPPGVELRRPRAIAGRWRWTAKRTEVEFRMRGALETPVTPRTRVGLRPDAPGPSTTPAMHERRAAVCGDTDIASPVPLDRRLDVLEALGVRFGAPRPAAIATDALPDDVDVETIVAVLHWAQGLGLIVREQAPGPESWADPVLERQLRGADRVRGIPVTSLVGGGTREAASPREEAVAPGDHAISGGGVASSWARRVVETGLEFGDRTLVVVARETARLPWQQRALASAEVVSIEELAVAFLDAHWQETGGTTPLRSMPRSEGAEAEEARLRLMRETSRRYARVAGSVPPLDAHDLRRAIHDEPLTIAPAQASGLDLDLLLRCAAEARSEFGWMTSAELRNASLRVAQRETQLVDRWRRRYRRVVLDGTHDFGDPLLAFARALAPESARWETWDPLLVTDPAPTASAGTESVAVPAEWAKAIQQLRRAEAPGASAGRQLRRAGSGTIERARVLTLRAAAEWIAEHVPADREPDRTAVVVAHTDDRTDLAVSLERHGLSAVPLRACEEWHASGPRHLLAALHLTAGVADAGLLDVIASLDPALDPADAEERFLRWSRAGEEGGDEKLDRHEVRLAALARLRGGIAADDRVVDAVRRVLDTGALDPLLRQDAASGRIAVWLAENGRRTVEEVRTRFETGLTVDPVSPTRTIFLLGPDDLVGPDHDHVVLIGSGYEAPARLVRALLRARRRFSLLHSENDPLA